MKAYIDDEYIIKKFGEKLDQRYLGDVRDVMQRYEDNLWWESDNPLEVAMYQIFENTLMVNPSILLKGLEELIGRDVQICELGLNMEGLRNEARAGIKRMKKETTLSEEDRTNALRDSSETIKDYCRETGTELLGTYSSRKNKHVLN